MHPFDVHFHVGAHKTATTYLQWTLRNNSELLSQNNIKYFGPQDMRHPNFSIKDCFEFQNDETKTPEEMSYPTKLMIFSDENMLKSVQDKNHTGHPSFYPHRTEVLTDFLQSFSGRKVRVFLGIRDTAGFFASYYSQKLVAGHVGSFDVFRKKSAFDDARWSDVVKSFLKFQDIDEIIVWQYENYMQVLPLILGKLLNEEIGKQIRILSEPLHVGLSEKAIQVILAEKQEKGKVTREFTRQVRENYPKSRRHPAPVLWTSSEMRGSHRRYEADVKEISCLDKVTLLNV